MTPCLTSKNIELLRKKAKELNPEGVPLPLQVSLSDHFQHLMQEVRREGASKTPFGRGFKANHALKKELDI
jgi:hypothetical protein